jgi:hypothetical protein
MNMELVNRKGSDPIAADLELGGATDIQALAARWDRADAMIDEWGLQSFPASDPPSNW